MEPRPALPDDYQGILDLAEAYQFQNLSPEERLQGFLSARFSLAQIAAMAEDLGIFIACEHGRIEGFLCASRFDWPETPPIIQSMFAAFDHLQFQGRLLSSQRVFLYGPVCIDLPFRGKGLLRGMFQCLNRTLAGRYEAGAVFVAADNPHSMDAHIRGLGMEAVGEFVHAGLSYHILAFRL